MELALGDQHTCALLDSGRVRCWGYNHRGQLGLGDPTLLDPIDALDMSSPHERELLPQCD
ncbi:hypothetical protein ENSA5_35430 [Enhygromyxa salina]|uniref:Regulator of chromosome condensation (RCC1) repeat protein n=1 Tax=Enhygromyxa salina TaxID=215803 RepID=A0A2S9XV75_9BACT|nr:RCC1 domain-containing protein [Enhygromyxa salina]PRP96769.1 hypothetical protein ENSA5_35430 [Enhygromyxa salina]